MEEPVSGLLEVNNDWSEDPTLEGPITSCSPVDDDWSDEVHQDIVGDLSEWSADILHALNSVLGKFNSVQISVAHDSSNDGPQATFCATSDFSDMSDSRDDIPQSTVCDMSNSSDTSSCSNDIPEATVCAMSDCSDGIPSAFLCAVSYCSDDVRPPSHCEMSYSSSDDFLEATVCAMSSYSDDVIPSSCCDMSYCSSVDILEAPTCQTEDTVAPQLSQLEDETTVALKFMSNRNKKFFLIDGYSKPLPLEVTLLILASQDPAVPEIVELLDWNVEPDHYVLVLERPMSFEELNWFVLRQITSIEEDVAQVIMQQAVFAAQTCCRRGVLYRDIKMENLLINPDTLEVKLIDFGCGDFLTHASYTSFAVSCDRRLLRGKPVTVWSLGILSFALVCGDFPKIQDLKKINNNTWAKDGLSEECCNMICCCLQIDPKQRSELEKLSLHNWIKIADKKK
ncbi:Serine/threonine-protein kinase pim-1 [Labeo rohita]|uniref:non-specific serine/threonine protein kinase n=1 Tax=Labeo rohita TaxID=84645 RepID=A0ABQ8MI55_LABRO|nr:Serine/threonine-protein kinase pim-1 [Labeo rohita]